MVFDVLANLQRLAAQNTPELTAKFSGSFISPSTQSFIDISRSLEQENQFTGTSLFQNQQQLTTAINTNTQNISTVNTSLGNVVKDIQSAFSSITQNQSIPTQRKENTTTDPSPTNETENPSIGASLTEGFSQLKTALGPLGLAAGIAIVGVLLLKK